MNLLIFGYFAAFFTAVSFLPQAIKTVKTRQTAGLSLLTYLFLFLGSLSWFIYGFYLTDYPLMITNSLTTIFTGIILYLIFSERNSKYN
ncbi:MAG: SemiSWEET family sugar transporter [Candidatus Actinomarina sp.]|jgi:MtN3 and saliva related transmembrane protein|nr:SemiSWEET transporter [Actinomycetota bacterium]MDA9608307.1 SemiSWEET transporter [Candidatus Actinomarina sp.]MDA9620102.1 SemiSWEET transporter [Candidatus Actinomarina sp.]MDA9675375.1 SemiSWEET transporter [Candidatus Actinomarina sp.]